MKKWICLIVLTPFAVKAEVTAGGFIDTYYAYDFNDPSSQDRSYTTQPSRHNEFNLNLAYVEAILKEENRRGRLALQYGTSVDANYAAEPVDNIKVVQEAFAGVKLNEKLWMDAGIFFSHIGFESFISKYNINYTRSFNADNVPYYSSGVRFEYQSTSSESFQFQVLNGWQNIQENNGGKAIGFQYKKLLSQESTFTYNLFMGDEKLTTDHSRFRSYNNFMLEKIHGNLTWQMSFDVGTQSQEEESGTDFWYVADIVLGQKIDEINKLGYRLEYYHDKDQANIVTNTPNGFQVVSSSVNYDRIIAKDTVWRSELRGYYSKDEIYPTNSSDLSRWDGVLVTSLALSF